MSYHNKPVSRILVVRLSALGDCVAAIPVFLELRKHYPHAHIAWAIQDNMAPLLQNLPGVDELIVFPRKRWQTLSSYWQWIKEVLRFVRRLKKRKFDMVIDVQSNSKSAVIAFCTRAKIRIGHGKGEAKEISAWLNNRLVDQDNAVQHVFYRNLRLLHPLGTQTSFPEFSIPKNKWLYKKIQDWLRQQNINTPFVLLIPFTGKAKKEWAPEKFTQLAALLAEQSISVVFLTSPGRRIETENMLPKNNGDSNIGDSVSISPELSIQEMVELIRSAACVVGGDTGPIHIAGAIEKNTCVLFGPTDPNRHKPWGPTTIYPLDTEPNLVSQDIIKQIESSAAKNEFTV